MTILVDATSIEPNQKGVGKYALNITRSIIHTYASVQRVVILVDKDPRWWLGEGHDVDVLSMVPASEIWKGLWALPRALSAVGATLLITPNECVVRAKGVRRLAICHDIDHLITKAQRLERGLTRKAIDATKRKLRIDGLRRCHTLVCNSEFTRAGVVNLYGVEEGRTRVAYCGVDDVFFSRNSKNDVRPRMKSRGGYILVFATGDSRENDDLIPEFISALRRQNVDSQVKIAGIRPEHSRTFRLLDRLRRSQHKEGIDYSIIEFIPYGHAAELATLYQEADFYVELSSHEGFGMQLAEAMASGTTCVSSTGSALGEVGRDYLIPIAHLSPDAIAECIADAYKARLHTRDNSEQVSFSRRYSWRRAGEVVCNAAAELLDEASGNANSGFSFHWGKL